MSDLPICAVLADIYTALKNHPLVVLQAPPGAGKSTYLPLQLLQQPELIQGTILLLEPRRLAAKAIAQFIAAELQQPVGQTVGYRMRGESCVSAQTRLAIVTEGVLTRMLQQDPMLEGVGLVIFDEFHERALQADLGLALTLDAQQGLRDDLKILIMSATLDNHQLQQQLQAPLIRCDGRQFPVVEHYVSCTAQNYLSVAADTVRQALQQLSGSVLVFLPGMAEIAELQRLLQQGGLPNGVQLYALHGRMDKALQQQAIAPSALGSRKVVLATNVAETSLTIDGISIVIDSGYRRMASFHPRSGFTQLQRITVSRSSMVQRMGRAGRLETGHCFHLSSEALCQRRIGFDMPELCSSDLSGLLFEVAAWGSHLSQLTWLDTPPDALVQQGYQLLQQLGLLDSEQQLTRFGRQAADLGLPPRLAALFLTALQWREQWPGIDALACVVVQCLMAVPSMTDCLVEVQLQRLLREQPMLQRQAQHFAKRYQIAFNHALPWSLLGMLLAQGFPDRIAKARGQGYVMANGFGVQLPPDSPLQRETWLLVLDAQLKDGQGRIRCAQPVDIELLQQLRPDLLQRDTRLAYSAGEAKIVAQQTLALGACVIRNAPLATLQDAQSIPIWLDWLQQQGLSCLNWDQESRQLQIRVQLACQFWPTQGWPDWSEQGLLQSMQQWLAPYLAGVTTLAQLQRLPLGEMLRAQLDWSLQQTLQQLLPDCYVAPTQQSHAICYQMQPNVATVSVQMQQMYGVSETPLLAQGLLPITFELLSPAQRPLQITQDLAHFWVNGYQWVQKEMKGRYPKHYWPDEPATAVATTRTKKFM